MSAPLPRQETSLSLRVDPDPYWTTDPGALPPPATADDGTVAEVRVRGKGALREVLETVALTLVVFLVARLLVQNYVVEGQSMTPSLADGQYLFIERVSYSEWDRNFLPRLLGQNVPANPRYVWGSGPQRGDIVVFHAWDEDRDYIKRVIGLPGETIAVHDKQVYINDRPLAEPYIKEAADYAVVSTTIPIDSLYVLGDNRNNSSDSHVKGVLPISQVIGRAWISYWPPGSIGFVPHATYSVP